MIRPPGISDVRQATDSAAALAASQPLPRAEAVDVAAGTIESASALRGQASSFRRRRIVFATKTEAYGGGERHLLGLLQRMDFAAVQPVILCFHNDPFSGHLNEVLRRSVEVHKASARSFGEFRRALTQARPDIVCFIFGSHLSFSLTALFAARWSGADRTVAIEHHILPNAYLPPMTRRGDWKDSVRSIIGLRARQRYERRATGWLWTRLIDLTACGSRATQDADVNGYYISKRATAVVLNGVNVKYFTPAREVSNLKTQLGVAESDRLLLHVGRLVKSKRLDLLVEACARLRAEKQPVTCLFIGEGPLEQALRLQAEALGITPWVRFLRFQADLRPFYRGADLFVLPSREEGFGLVLAEAFACGLPCVASRVGGVPEVVSDGVDGWLVEPESVEALTEGIRKALLQAGKLREFGERGRTKVVDQFDEDRQAAEMLRVLFGEWAVRSDQLSDASQHRFIQAVS